MAEREGTIVGAPIVTPTTQDKYPTFYTIDGYGGWKNVASITERNAIPLERRQTGMEVKVLGDATYELVGGLTDEYWVKVPGGDGGTNDTIATKIEITLTNLGVATIAEVTDAMVKNHINGLGLVKSKKEFYVVNVVDINFDVKGDWEEKGIVDGASFAIRLGVDESNVENFSLVNGRLKAKLGGISQINFNVLGITIVHNISIVGLIKLNLGHNQIVSFDPNTPLSIGLSQLNLNTNQIVSFNPDISLPTGLSILNLTDNQIISFNPDIPLPIGLSQLNLRNNQIVNFNPDIPLPTGLIQLNLSRNKIVSFNPDTPLPTGLAYLNLSFNQIVSFNPDMPLPTGLVHLDLNHNQIADWSLSEEFANSLQSGSILIYTSGNLTSSAGTTFKSILESKGHTVISD